jgi:hypothetical protein
MRLLNKFFKDDTAKVDMWLHTKNNNFGGQSPCYVIARGRALRVLQFVRQAADDAGWDA